MIRLSRIDNDTQITLSSYIKPVQSMSARPFPLPFFELSPSSGSIPSLEQLNSPYSVELSLSSSSASGVVLFESKTVSRVGF